MHAIYQIICACPSINKIHPIAQHYKQRTAWKTQPLHMKNTKNHPSKSIHQILVSVQWRRKRGRRARTSHPQLSEKRGRAPQLLPFVTSQKYHVILLSWFQNNIMCIRAERSKVTYIWSQAKFAWGHAPDPPRRCTFARLLCEVHYANTTAEYDQAPLAF